MQVMKTSTLVIILAIVIMFFSFLTSTTATLPYDPWFDTDDNGKIDIKDIGEASIRYGTYGTPIINRTELLLYLNETVHEHEERIGILEEKVAELEYKVAILNATKLGEPDYDSFEEYGGWVPMIEGEDTYHIFEHGLNTTKVLVYVIGYDNQTGTIHQHWYGGQQTLSFWNGVFWRDLTKFTVEVYKYGSDREWDQVRVMLWKLP